MHSQFWALAKPKPAISSGSYGPTTPGGTGASPTVQETNDNDARIVAEIGEEFAAHINPAMQKALALQANAPRAAGQLHRAHQQLGSVLLPPRPCLALPEPPGPVTS